MKKIKNKNVTIGVIGLGYVGLPLCIRFAQEQFRVTGFDIDIKKVESLNKSVSYIKHISSENIKIIRGKGLFKATTDYSKLRTTDCIIICVPTPLKKIKNLILVILKILQQK